jgi:hypothetical protein
MPLNPNYSGVEQNIEITEVNGLQSAIDTKSNIASPTFTGKTTFTKEDNFGQIEITDTKPIAAGVGGGITFNGVYGAHGQITAFAHIKSKKSNGIVGDYHGDLSLSVRENGSGGYTEIIRLEGESSRTIIRGGLNFSNLPTSASGLASGDIYSNGGVLTIV